MKKICALMVVLLGLLTACDEKAEQVAVEWPFYTIAKEEQTVGYLLGTMHVGKAEWFPLPEELTDAIDQSDAVLTEIKLHDGYSSDVTAQMIAEASDYKKLPDYFNAAQLQELERKVATYIANPRIDLKAMTLLELDGLLSYSYLGQDGVVDGVEYALFGYLYKTGHLDKNSGLETSAESLWIGNEYMQQGIEDPEQWLADLPTYDENFAELEKMFAAYENNELEAFLLAEAESAEDILVVPRNLQWIDPLTTQLEKNEQTFIAVGAAHLYFEDGLLDLLAECGYVVEAVE